MTDRPRLDQLTDDKLDQLYDELDLTVGVIQTLRRQLDDAETAIERARAELHTLNSEVRGLNPIALAGRRDAVARIRAALDGTT